MNHETYLDALLSLPDLAFEVPLVSRDGRYVAWTWYRTGPAGDVFVAPTDGSAAPTRLTQTSDHSVLVSWTPDSSAVLVAQDRDGNERACLYRVDLARPGEMLPLTEQDPGYFLRGGQLHPNGRWLVYAMNWDVNSGSEIEQTWIYRHDLETGERLPLAKPQRNAYLVPKMNSTGTHVLYTRKDRHPAGSQVWMVDIEGREDVELFNFGAQVKTTANWFPDGRRVLVTSETPTHRRVGVWEMGEAEVRWVLDDPDVDVESAEAPEGSQAILVIENRVGRTGSLLIDPEDGSLTRLDLARGNLVLVAPARDEAWVAVFFHSQQPFDVVRLDKVAEKLDERRFVSLSRVWERTRLTPADMTPAEPFAWESIDGLRVHGWLYRAKEEPRGAVVHVHGGPTWHSPDWIDAEIQYLVRCGFNVLDPNYRGSTGYGLRFREAILEQGWGGLEQEDIRYGIRALIEAGLAQAGTVGITGTSYGGYSSWFAITHFPPEEVRAAAPICGMTDLVVDYETTRPDLRPYSEEMMGGSPEQAPERYRERSPIYFVGDMRGKLLIVQGAQDPNVTPENVRQVIAALEEAGKGYELLVFENEGHGISRPENKRTLYARLAAFFGNAFAG